MPARELQVRLLRADSEGDGSCQTVVPNSIRLVHLYKPLDVIDVSRVAPLP